MKKTILVALTMTLSLTFLLVSCSKHNPHNPPPATDSATLCRIESMYADLSNTPFYDVPSYHLYFNYDGTGNPVKEYSTAGFTVFRYDAKGRLSDEIGHSTSTPGPDGWLHFTYPSPSLILDSAFQAPGDTSDPNPPVQRGTLSFTDSLTLDTQGRIVSALRSYPGTNLASNTTIYRYDAAGNFQFPSSIMTYDDKISIYRTNKVWQLLYRNYSRNNPSGYMQTPDAYNSVGLPTHFVGPAADPAFGLYYGQLTVTYACDVSSPSLGH